MLVNTLTSVHNVNRSLFIFLRTFKKSVPSSMIVSTYFLNDASKSKKKLKFELVKYAHTFASNSFYLIVIY